MAKRPNVLFVLSDQHNAKVLGHAGHPDVRTPALDRMAAEGVRFVNAITQNPICTPSRMCWYSGQYCHNHGYYGLSGPNPNGLPNVFGHFRRAGYRTALIGKGHGPEYWIEDQCDEFHETCHCSIGGRSAAYTEHLQARGAEGLEDHHPDNCRRLFDGRPSHGEYEDSCEGWSARKAIEFMAAARSDGEPFFVTVCPPKPHSPYTPSQRFWDLYDEEAIQLPPNVEYDYAAAGKAPHLIATAQWWRTDFWLRFEPKTFEAGRRRKLRGYLGNVTQVDFAVGELLAWLDEAQLADDTIVVYSTDHGDYATEHGQLEKAPGVCSDAITRIPFLWRWPGKIAAGVAHEQLVETVDLVDTLCNLCELEPMATSDGVDITGLLNGKPFEPHSIAVTEFAWSKSVRKGKHRLVWYPREMFAEQYPDGFGELYDLQADPWEMKNLYFDAAHAGVVAELRADLLNWLVTTTRPTTVHGHLAHAGAAEAVRRYHHRIDPDGKMSPAAISLSGIPETHKNYL